MATQAQIEANRKNAQLSTGPRTKEGKARSKLNAVTHGLTAQTPLLPPDNLPLYHALKDQLLSELDPQSGLQLTLANQIVLVSWKLNTLPSVEARLLAEQALQDPAYQDWQKRLDSIRHDHARGDTRQPLPAQPPLPTSITLIARSFLPQKNEAKSQKNPLERLDARQAALQRQFSKLIKDYQALQLSQKIEPNPTPSPASDPSVPSSPNEPNSTATPVEADSSTPTPLTQSDLEDILDPDPDESTPPLKLPQSPFFHGVRSESDPRYQQFLQDCEKARADHKQFQSAIDARNAARHSRRAARRAELEAK